MRRFLADRGEYRVTGIPQDTDATAAAVLRSRLISAATEFTKDRPQTALAVTVTNRPGDRIPASVVSESPAVDASSLDLAVTAPKYGFDLLVLPPQTMEQLSLAIARAELAGQIYGRWGLKAIEPHPRSIISLHGRPGTGKTIAAHAIASRLRRRIVSVRCSDLESKYHGEGPKNVAAAFQLAARHGAVLFLDEADAVLSRRFSAVTQGSEQAINAMRSQMLVALDSFEGVVVFASNLAESYDEAFHSRLQHVYFPDPGRAERLEIWRRHLPPELPIAADVSLDELAGIGAMGGRDIKNAVLDAATATAMAGRTEVDQSSLRSAAERIKANRVPRSSLTASR
ncbi:ATP-binding protein [Actinoplanes subglobosus]|uniref:ATP-binding protein n=1 Tax=Actinoplanes subglobosus TaxID=1547892 RepID=A0ABV8J559_9ACTN